MSNDPILDLALQQANEYIQYDINPQTMAEVQTLLVENKHDIILSLFGSRIAFGTAGLRAPMGPGYSKINDLIILQTSQGLAEYIIKIHGDKKAKESGIIIGYDHRRYQSMSSQRFARVCAAVFLAQGYNVYLLENEVATPLVAFGVRYMKCIAGFMVTASHNPAKDNGFKMYWNNGAQIIPPHDQGVSEYILKNLSPRQTYDIDNVLNNPLAKNVTDEVSQAYFSQLPHLSDYPHNNESNLKVAYTAMHGVGYQWITRAFHAWGHKSLFPVTCQMHPDPDFPTVSFPNPEEKGALNEAMKYAEENDCTLILANDPDADRLAVAERLVLSSSSISHDKDDNIKDDSISSTNNKKRKVDTNGTTTSSSSITTTSTSSNTTTDSTSKWHVFTGNEIGVLLGHWMITQYKHNLQKQHQQDESNTTTDTTATITTTPTTNKVSSSAAVLASIVSSRFLKKIAAVENIDYYDTLTGFKWLANRSTELREAHPPINVLFAYEEALGYCVSDLVCDKDGLSAACIFLEMANQLSFNNSCNSNNSSSSSSRNGNSNNDNGNSSKSNNNTTTTTTTTNTIANNANTTNSPMGTVYQHLKNLEAKYGVYVSYNSYVLSYDKNITDAIFKRLRSQNKNDTTHKNDTTSTSSNSNTTNKSDTTSSSSSSSKNNDSSANNSISNAYFTHIGGVKVMSVKDITLGYDSTAPDSKCTLPLTPDSHMIMFEFENSVTCTLRTSGTEPKIKYYTEIAGMPGQTREELEQTLHAFVNTVIVEEMLQPALHGLKRPA